MFEVITENGRSCDESGGQDLFAARSNEVVEVLREVRLEIARVQFSALDSRLQRIVRLDDECSAQVLAKLRRRKPSVDTLVGPCPLHSRLGSGPVATGTTLLAQATQPGE